MAYLGKAIKVLEVIPLAHSLEEPEAAAAQAQMQAPAPAKPVESGPYMGFGLAPNPNTGSAATASTQSPPRLVHRLRRALLGRE